ncbi:hypothetical protein ACLESO_59830, partial [Pyxidicoccus sp. 3LG]
MGTRYSLVALLRVSASGETAYVLAPDETLCPIPYATLTAAVQSLVEFVQGPVADRVLERAGLPGNQRERFATASCWETWPVRETS